MSENNSGRKSTSQEELWFEMENRRLIEKMKAKKRSEHLKLVPKSDTNQEPQHAAELPRKKAS